jgi:Uncharacterized protein conserved in bacteria
MIRYVIGALMVLVGVVAAMQAPVNAALARRSSVPQAVVVSFAVSFIIGALVLLIVAFTQGKVTPTGLREAPWWQFTGGLIGATIVFGATAFVPRLGALGVVAALVAGQFLGGALIDRFGLVGMPIVQLTWSRLVGLGLLSLGGFLVVRR